MLINVCQILKKVVENQIDFIFSTCLVLKVSEAPGVVEKRLKKLKPCYSSRLRLVNYVSLDGFLVCKIISVMSLLPYILGESFRTQK